MSEDREKAEILKKALTIVDKLANAVDEVAEFTPDEQETILELIEQAKKLKRHRLWKLR